MGLGIVLLFWAVIGTVLALGGMIIFGGVTALSTRGAVKGRGSAIAMACLFPIACLAWAGGLFVFQAIVNEGLLHRDLGIGDTWHAPVSNGYQIMMIDVTDQGRVYNPKTQSTSGMIGDQEDSVSGVRLLQIADPYILGGVDRQAFEHRGEDSNQIDSYFVLNTRTGKNTILPNYGSLQEEALQLGIRTELEPINVVYSRYRFSWFDVFVGVLFFVPPLIGFFLLLRRVVRLRQTRGLMPETD